MISRFVFTISLLTALLLANEAKSQEITTELTGEVSSFTLTISGLQKAKGEVRIAVFDSEDKYKKETVYAVVIPADSTILNWTVPDLPFGEYAIAVFHDRNTNGELDTNILGIPKEEYGFSNNARGRFGPASWEDAKFEVNRDQMYHQIEVN